jgi:ABC-type nitrate/sulfonate/bicarbonate transport system substrate-binding protein
LSVHPTRKPSFRWIVVSCLLLLAGALIIYPLSCGLMTGTSHLTLAQVPTPHAALPIIAEKNGYFRDEGLEVTVKEFTTGKLCFDAMLGGGAEVCTVAETPLVFAGFSNQPVAVVGTIESSNQTLKLLARKDKRITKPEDLRGKVVGTFKGSSAEYFLTEILRESGMTIQDVKVTYMQPPELVTAIIRGDLAGIAMWEPNIYAAEKALHGEAVIFTGADLYTETFHIAVMQSFAEENGDRVEKFLRALSKAEDFLKSDPDVAKRIVGEKLAMQSDVLDHIWPCYRFELDLDHSVIMQIEKEAQFARQSGAVPPDRPMPNYRAMFDPRYLQAINPSRVRLGKHGR